MSGLADILTGLGTGGAGSVKTVTEQNGYRVITSVCSAHPLVLEAAMAHGAASGRPVLIEATCNQVNHQGGYTGLDPAGFRGLVGDLAARSGLPAAHLLLGGDHLGPNPWTARPAEAAMAEAETMVAAYVAAGFRKLHLDTSMRCADDPATLPVAVIAARAARLSLVAERVAETRRLPLPVYVIGTEVPPPGGALETIEALEPTPPAMVEATIAAQQAAFAAAGLPRLMERVIAVVVQPGVEFGHSNVVPYDPAAAVGLRRVLVAHPGFVFEAHSTDYQPADRLAALAADGFAILKVGPALTFALREGFYALSALAKAMQPDAPSLPAIMEQLMLAHPQQWERHYRGDAGSQRVMRHFSYSDRIRYYWSMAEARTAVDVLLSGLGGVDIPLPLVSQFLPTLYQRVRDGLLPVDPRAWLLALVGDVLGIYAGAGNC
jgi:D-tagatose-bisphosphate aldolase class II non-catalytic subunit